MSELFTLRNYDRQLHSATKLMVDFERYAKTLGCKIEGEEIVANREQAEKLQAWWTGETGQTR